jgi:hypothetical protein
MSRTIVRRLRGPAAGTAVPEYAEPGAQLGPDLVRQPGELPIEPAGQRVGAVVLQRAGAGEDVGDVREGDDRSQGLRGHGCLPGERARPTATWTVGPLAKAVMQCECGGFPVPPGA